MRRNISILVDTVSESLPGYEHQSSLLRKEVVSEAGNYTAFVHELTPCSPCCILETSILKSCSAFLQRDHIRNYETYLFRTENTGEGSRSIG